jgi:hypothetical protein
MWDNCAQQSAQLVVVLRNKINCQNNFITKFLFRFFYDPLFYFIYIIYLCSGVGAAQQVLWLPTTG